MCMNVCLFLDGVYLHCWSTQIDTYSLVTFMPLNVKDENSIDSVLGAVDMSLQYGEDLDVKVHVCAHMVWPGSCHCLQCMCICV